MGSLDERLRAALGRPEDEGPAGRAVDVLLAEAVEAGVSDVHLTPGPDGLQVHFRQDGVLQSVLRIDPAWAERIIGRVKVLAGLLTYRRDLPQDGQIPAAQAGGRTDVRVSTFPTLHGERAVLRFFLHESGTLDLEKLGFRREIVEPLRAAIRRPDGVVLLTGPSGSGKTTTIYALLEEIVRPASGISRHVVTIEDPVERAIPGLTQTQIHPASGLTFASALRSLLRQDPQVIMVGEIRDAETAKVAMEAGLTGHLVISTIHAGTAAGVVTRLLEMGVEPHVLTSSLSAVLAQRLVRRRCPCGPGCADCRQTGFRGRTAFGELMILDDALRTRLASAPDRAALEAKAVEQGMVPLRAAGETLVRAGLTTPEELRRVLG